MATDELLSVTGILLLCFAHMSSIISFCFGNIKVEVVLNATIRNIGYCLSVFVFIVFAN